MCDLQRYVIISVAAADRENYVEPTPYLRHNRIISGIIIIIITLTVFYCLGRRQQQQQKNKIFPNIL